MRYTADMPLQPCSHLLTQRGAMELLSFPPTQPQAALGGFRNLVCRCMRSHQRATNCADGNHGRHRGISVWHGAVTSCREPARNPDTLNIRRRSHDLHRHHHTDSHCSRGDV